MCTHFGNEIPWMVHMVRIICNKNMYDSLRPTRLLSTYSNKMESKYKREGKSTHQNPSWEPSTEK